MNQSATGRSGERATGKVASPDGASSSTSVYASGAFWEGVWERLDGAGVFWMPDFGWILIAGPFAAWVVASLDNSSLFSGLSAFGSAIYSIGIPLQDIPRYETDLERGALLLVVHGSATTVQNARRLFDRFKKVG